MAGEFCEGQTNFMLNTVSTIGKRDFQEVPDGGTATNFIIDCFKHAYFIGFDLVLRELIMTYNFHNLMQGQRAFFLKL
jgi:hypothetical protein